MIKRIACLLVIDFMLCAKCSGYELPGPIVPFKVYLNRTEGYIQPFQIRAITGPQAFEWIIELPVEDEIFIRIVRFDIPHSESCRFAYLDIFDGPNALNYRLSQTKLCGRLENTLFLSSNNKVNVVYYTSGENKGKMFTIKYGMWSKVNHCGIQYDVKPNLSKETTPNGVVLNSAEGSWPWLVTLTRDSKIFCHGSILTPRHVVTSAHCLNSLDSSKVTVAAGKHVSYRREPGEQSVAVKGIHPVNFDHDDTDENFDVTILFLERNITFTPYVKDVCLPPERYNVEKDSFCAAVGWGFSVNKKGSKQLQELKLKLDSDKVYKKRLKQAKITSKLSSFMTATVALSDSSKFSVDKIMQGSPLVCSTDNRWLAVGILKQTIEVKEGNKNKVVFIYKKLQEHLTNLELITGIDVPIRSYHEAD